MTTAWQRAQQRAKITDTPEAAVCSAADGTGSAPVEGGAPDTITPDLGAAFVATPAEVGEGAAMMAAAHDLHGGMAFPADAPGGYRGPDTFQPVTGEE